MSIRAFATAASSVALAFGCGATPIPQSALDAKTTIDPRAQAIAVREVQALGALPSTREAHVVVMNPRDSAVVAMIGGMRRGAAFELDRALPSRAAHVPGSVMKPFTIAIAVDSGAIALDSRWSGEDGAWVLEDKTLRDASPHGEMSLGDVLAYSSNIATAKIFLALGAPRLAPALARFGFDTSPLARASTFDAALVAGGEAGHATPLQVASAYAALFDGGVYHSPSFAPRARDAGTPAVSEPAARAVVAMLEGVVSRADATGTKARMPGVRVAGKTGTAEEGSGTYGTFVGAFPIEAPRYLVLVAVASSDASYSGGSIAAPAFRRVAEQVLAISPAERDRANP